MSLRESSQPNYIIVEGRSVHELEQKVNEFYSKGYIATGGLNVTKTSGYVSERFLQSMTLANA